MISGELCQAIPQLGRFPHTSIFLAFEEAMCCHNLASAFRLNPSQSRAVIVGLLSLEETLTNDSFQLARGKMPDFSALALPLMWSQQGWGWSNFSLWKRFIQRSFPCFCTRVRPQPWINTTYFSNYPEAAKEFLHFIDRRQRDSNLSSFVHTGLGVEIKHKCS